MLAFNSGLQDAQMLHLQSQPVFLAQPEFSYAEEFLQNLVSKNCSIDEAKNRLGAISAEETVSARVTDSALLLDGAKVFPTAMSKVNRRGTAQLTRQLISSVRTNALVTQSARVTESALLLDGAMESPTALIFRSSCSIDPVLLQDSQLLQIASH
eukprot:CAMPEP_0168615338 /NCGR_PEP_ID=MMETSP0449_2-20121227/4452_1 /TAXON_ID=1082188 /ORGANISM="Strombidium rassoulzadegani, Strain ras09" /LENGTH=154 /DNA_ID=CAMNT_0008656073 /DNA_START=19 /DNA_END=481 /DNA_ORIENTATION=+